MSDFEAITVGDTFLLVWKVDGLGRQITARRGQLGAQYGLEVSPGDWRYSSVPGSAKVQFQRHGQLTPFFRLMLARG